MPDRVREVSLPGGKTLLGKEMDFEVIHEAWNEYRLSDGTRVRVKNVVLRIYLVVDEAGNPQYDDDGNPIIIVNGNTNIAATRVQE